MSDFAETRTSKIDSRYSVEHATSALSEWMASEFGVSTPSLPKGEIDLGSRFRYRMHGAIWGSFRLKTKNLPLTLSWTIMKMAAGASIEIHLRSNEGPYLIRTYQHHLIYERRFDELTCELERLLG